MNHVSALVKYIFMLNQLFVPLLCGWGLAWKSGVLRNVLGLTKDGGQLIMMEFLLFKTQ
ncbi:MAG: hypothetical protein H7836_13335 [Magnetococcus sp. YQC-3]